MQAHLFEEVELGKFGHNFALPEGVLLVWQLGIELPTSVFVKDLVPSVSCGVSRGL